MRSLLTRLLATCALVSCVGSVGESGEPPPDGSGTKVSDETAAPVTPVTPGPKPNDCELLPRDGACSLACDPAAMAEKYVPTGACALFACPLTDGRTMFIDVCHSP